MGGFGNHVGFPLDGFTGFRLLGPDVGLLGGFGDPSGPLPCGLEVPDVLAIGCIDCSGSFSLFDSALSRSCMFFFLSLSDCSSSLLV